MATVNYDVTVGAYAEGNRYQIDGAKTPNLFLVRGNTYIFDVSDATNATHTMGFATAADAAGSTEYTSGVTSSGTAGSAGATVTFVVPSDAAETLFYYCTAHSSMSANAAIFVSGVEITPISDKSAVADITVTDFSANTSIFTNTLAREIPSKIDSIASDFKTHINDNFADVVVGDVNAFIDGLETYLNGTVVAAINTAIESIRTDGTKFAGDIAKEQTEFEGGFEARFQGLEDGLSTYVGDEASYTKAQIDTTLFTGAISSTNISHDSDGRLSSIKANGKLIWNITYDSDGFLEGFRESVDIGGLPVTKVYNVITDADGLIEAIEDIS
jgi:hypothetical protein